MCPQRARCGTCRRQKLLLVLPRVAGARIGSGQHVTGANNSTHTALPTPEWFLHHHQPLLLLPLPQSPGPTVFPLRRLIRALTMPTHTQPARKHILLCACARVGVLLPRHTLTLSSVTITHVPITTPGASTCCLSPPDQTPEPPPLSPHADSRAPPPPAHPPIPRQRTLPAPPSAQVLPAHALAVTAAPIEVIVQALLALSSPLAYRPPLAGELAAEGRADARPCAHHQAHGWPCRNLPRSRGAVVAAAATAAAARTHVLA